MTMHATITRITDRIIERSVETRQGYLSRCDAAAANFPPRRSLSCGNLAHAFAASEPRDKLILRSGQTINIGIVSAYNDMLSAHQPLQHYPDIIRETARRNGCTAQFAGGTPAMCDGVTQGTPGMELSLFSRDVIAASTAIALSHNMFDAVICLGVCDKIVPGLLIGALSFGHLPAIMFPAGPMRTGISNEEKSRVRQLYAQGKATREDLMDAEAGAYHREGTCTFYGTANSNQMLMEAMGLHVPGSALVNPDDPLRRKLLEEASTRAIRIALGESECTPISRVVDEKCIVNALVALLATGGSTNHTIHWITVAKAAGVLVDWTDFEELSAVTPLLARLYPNGQADVNDFQHAGGTEFIIRELLDAGLLHPDVTTIQGPGLEAYTRRPRLEGQALVREPPACASGDDGVLRPVSAPFAPDGGIRLLEGNLGRAIIKVSAVPAGQRRIEAPAMVFDSQEQLLEAFQRDELERDFVAVIRHQGPASNGMPELHKLTPCLGVLQDRGYQVALVTDGRMSGASGRVPAALHLSPETARGGPISRVRDGDPIRLDADARELMVRVEQKEWEERDPVTATPGGEGLGRELFAVMRETVSAAEAGATIFRFGEH